MPLPAMKSRRESAEHTAKSRDVCNPYCEIVRGKPRTGDSRLLLQKCEDGSPSSRIPTLSLNGIEQSLGLLFYGDRNLGIRCRYRSKYAERKGVRCDPTQREIGRAH